MFVIMSKSKYYAMEMLLGTVQNNCDALETQLMRCEKRLKQNREALEKAVVDHAELCKKISDLTERLEKFEDERAEMLDAANKAEKAFTDGVANILNYTGGKKE